MSAYTDAFQHLIEGNYTGAVTSGYTHGLGIGNFFYVFLMFALIIPVYLKTKSLMLVSLTILVLATTGLMSNTIFSESSITANLNFIAIFGLMLVIGFAIPIFQFLKRRE